MTPQEAIHTIKHGCIFRDKRGGEALEVAVKALKKQIPKKPKFDSNMPKCPSCKQWIDNNATIQKYCNFCGQALYWGDTE